MKTQDFDYDLPQEFIAQTPVEPRDHSRLMVLNRSNGSIEHRFFYEITDYLRPGDVLVLNDSRVIPARLYGHKGGSGGKAEILLIKRLDDGIWEALVRPARRLPPGSVVELDSKGLDHIVKAEILGVTTGSGRTVKFSDEAELARLGEIPLPPYINEPLQDTERYQTVYSKNPGSVAAPTAGLHFTPELLQKITDRGAECLFITLHVGLDTFQPVREDNPQEHHIHSEYAILSPEVASRLSLARKEGRRIIATGTTACRVLEHAGLSGDMEIKPFSNWVNLFILPGHNFRVVSALITNFHLPRSTTLMLVSAFAGKELLQHAYQVAKEEGYRFYSFGDAMLVL